MTQTIDMSPKAVSSRLRLASELRDLCLALAGPRLKWDWRRPAAADVRPVVKEGKSGYGRADEGGCDKP